MSEKNPPTWLQRLGRWLLRVTGWKPVMNLPDAPKFVAVGYPHTSNWDFFPALFWGWASGLPFKWIGKKELFPPLLGRVMVALGGIPVDRKNSRGFVGQMADYLKRPGAGVVVIAPDGTRKRAPHWRTGFYYMALEADVPVALGYINYETREVGVGDWFLPSGDLEADFEKMRTFYEAHGRGLNPAAHTPIVPRPRSEAKTHEPAEVSA
ncbi:MAG TPA: glycerol acyltransferase [Oceanithermus profundus]|uniref:Glycerol acyltransferase n=1 Tax=Oceanithermus profundus TaxID=187137 RepID=A0A7C4V749_9DEIN|nr:glycerol acyltransferase [Oceanithermus profundus]